MNIDESSFGRCLILLKQMRLCVNFPLKMSCKITVHFPATCVKMNTTTVCKLDFMDFTDSLLSFWQ